MNLKQRYASRRELTLEATSLSTMAHMDELAKWVAEHNIDAIWLPLTQVIEYDTGRRMIWYDEYLHSEDGEPIITENQIATKRVTHSCRRTCVNSWPPLWLGP